MDDAERFWSKVNKSGECWEWSAALNGYGYGKFGMKQTTVFAHRLSYVIHHPLTIDLLDYPMICVCHKCDNPRCVNPSHLFLGSYADNVKDMYAKGRGGKTKAKGEKQHLSKLTETQVREIRGRYAEGGITQQTLGIEYGVSQPTIGHIIRRETWPHI